MQVVVTRPEREARRWVHELEQRGMQAWALPLISIHPPSDQHALRAAWEHLNDYVALMFVSAPALEHFFAVRLPSDPDLSDPAVRAPRVWVTGPGTAAVAVRQGVDAARIDTPALDSQQLDSEALWTTVGARVRSGDRVLIVRGSDAGETPVAGSPAAPGFGRDWLARRLRQAGAQVDFVVGYRRGAPDVSPAQQAQARAAAADGSCWLFTSAQAVANLARVLPGQDWSGARALATHPRIAAAARAAGFGVVEESRPGVSDVVASIESIG